MATHLHCNSAFHDIVEQPQSVVVSESVYYKYYKYCKSGVDIAFKMIKPSNGLCLV